MHFAVIIYPEIKSLKSEKQAEEEEREILSSQSTRRLAGRPHPFGNGDEHKPFLRKSSLSNWNFSPKAIHLNWVGEKEKHFIMWRICRYLLLGILITASSQLQGLATLTHTPSPMGLFGMRIMKRPSLWKSIFIISSWLSLKRKFKFLIYLKNL